MKTRSPHQIRQLASLMVRRRNLRQRAIKPRVLRPRDIDETGLSAEEILFGIERRLIEARR